MRGATSRNGYISRHHRFQSTLPMRGATACFNPGGQRQRISIHAPHAGSDAGRDRLPAAPYHFNPRSPCGERRRGNCSRCYCDNFNPRSPCGERPSPTSMRTGLGNFNPRSPCGERQETCLIAPFVPQFQSTLPMRGATSRMRAIYRFNQISIHAPHAGSDEGNSSKAIANTISIHAPHAGSDQRRGGRIAGNPDFNPRSPCGERHGYFG